eukprot:COSAG02_NODE_4978_length_4758_cov_20.123739_2_plen_192_part_00
MMHLLDALNKHRQFHTSSSSESDQEWSDEDEETVKNATQPSHDDVEDHEQVRLSGSQRLRVASRRVIFLARLKQALGTENVPPSMMKTLSAVDSILQKQGSVGLTKKDVPLILRELSTDDVMEAPPLLATCPSSKNLTPLAGSPVRYSTRTTVPAGPTGAPIAFLTSTQVSVPKSSSTTVVIRTGPNKVSD